MLNINQEQLRSTSSTVGTTSNCSTGADGTFSYRVTGVSAGPYPGTFNASGQVTLSHDKVIAFTEQFKITSGKNQLLSQTVSVRTGGTGFCVPDIGLANIPLTYHVTATLADGSHSQASGDGRATILGGPSAPNELLQNFVK
jgi:hypothetical protein